MVKKGFDKKQSDTFHVVHRSKRDVEGNLNDEAPKLVLAPAKLPRRQQAKKGSTDGVNLPKDVLPSKEIKDRKMPFYYEVDPEIDEALEYADEFEELPDDFITIAEKEESVYDEEDDFDEDFDENDLADFDEDNFDNDLDDIDDEITPSSMKNKSKAKPKPEVPLDEHRKLFEERFEKIAAEYDDDDIGELDDEDPTAHGTNEVDVLDDAMDEFLEQMKQKQTPYQPDNEVTKDYLGFEPKTKNDEGFDDVDNVLREKVLQKIPEESDSESDKEYVRVEREDEQWDCESIISTYSNLDNHPKIIIEPGRNRKQIQLNEKTGVPVGVLPKKKKAPVVEETAENKGKSRPKQEDKEEKKLRKQQIKEEKKQNRERKKSLKVAFKGEELKQQKLMKANPGMSIKVIN